MAVLPLVLQIAVALASSSPIAEPRSVGVNLVAGDLSALAGYVPAGLPAALDERARVQGHLRFAHDLLARVDTTGWPIALRAARARNLDRLARYAEAGAFPYNDDHPDAHRPTFVDRSGALCAVGALLAADRGRAAAERVAASYKYAFIAQIDDGELAMWQQQSGLAPEELALIQPAYGYRPTPNRGDYPLWLPFGLLDRMQLSPFRASVSSEVGTTNDTSASSVTLHAQMSTPCDCKFGVYGTLPASIRLDGGGGGLAAAGGPVPGGDMPRTILGTADVGLFGANQRREKQTLFRVGALLPTGARTPHAWLPSARAGDAVLELGRSAGVRLSTSTIMGWHSWPGDVVQNVWEATRLDLGVDVAAELVGNDAPVHIIPRAGIGTMFTRERGTLSIDTAVSLDPFVDRNVNLRWSAGITGRLARVDGTGWYLHPALSLAVVRTPGGWGGNLMFDLAASARPARHYDES